MRFIFEFVTCCMISTPCNSNADETSSHATSPRKAEEETRSLVSRSGRRRQRTPRGTASADWRPSLFAIAEDNAVAAAPEKVSRPTAAAPGRQQPSQRNVQRCGASSARVNANSRSYNYSRDPIPIVVPAFSVAPFMF